MRFKTGCLVVVLALLGAFGSVQAQRCLPAWSPRSAREQRLWTAERNEWQRYLNALPRYLERLGPTPDPTLLMPVAGVKVADVIDSWKAARSFSRQHEGQDIFAPLGTPVRSATDGYIWRISERVLGGKSVTVVGDGGMRYYYAHLSRYADIREGERVTPRTLLGFVGKSGNARTTPPHLHFGLSTGNPLRCERRVFDPLPRLRDR